MAGLQFKFREFIQEMTAIQTIATPFLDPSKMWALEQLKSQVEYFWGRPGSGTIRLDPLVTIASKGYEPGGAGGVSVVAKITGIWDVATIGPEGKKAQAKPKRRLEFCGVASTKIEIYKEDDRETRLAMWRMELGDELSPGCYFHIHALGDADQPPFPKSIPIPRFPSIFITPMGVIEFVLGELFQDEWRRATGSNQGDNQFWRKLQSDRLKRLLQWQNDVIADGEYSPWMTIKRAKPDSKLFQD